MPEAQIAEHECAVKQFELLLTEKELADSMIRDFAALNVKVLTFFGAGIVLLGWMYSDKAPASMAQRSSHAGIVAIVLVAISCSVVLQGLANYGRALTYIQYKNDYLNEQFARLLRASVPPLQAVAAWGRSAPHKAVVVATSMLLIMHLAASGVLLVFSAYCFPFGYAVALALAASWTVLLTTWAVELMIAGAARRIFAPTS